MVIADGQLAQWHAVVGNCGARFVSIPPPLSRPDPDLTRLGLYSLFEKKGYILCGDSFFFFFLGIGFVFFGFYFN